jgi:hypothetical protein
MWNFLPRGKPVAACAGEPAAAPAAATEGDAAGTGSGTEEGETTEAVAAAATAASIGGTLMDTPVIPYKQWMLNESNSERASRSAYSSKHECTNGRQSIIIRKDCFVGHHRAAPVVADSIH